MRLSQKALNKTLENHRCNFVHGTVKLFLLSVISKNTTEQIGQPRDSALVT